MSIKMTYGKRKNSLLSLFPAHKDDDKSLQLNKPKTEKRVSAVVSMTAFYGKRKKDPNRNNPSTLDDSIEEMASMLLDDTTINQLAGEPGKRLSKLGSAKVLPQSHRQGFFHDKALPQLPELFLSSEDGWNTRSHHIVTAAGGVSNNAESLSCEEEPDNCPTAVPRQSAHGRKSSAPPLPRKSSKRTSRKREQREFMEARNTRGDDKRQLEPRKLSKIVQQNAESLSPMKIETPHRSVTIASPNVSQQIETPKPGEGGLAIDSSVVSKGSGMKGNKVFSKMKLAITERLRDKGVKKHHHSARSELLLDPNLSQLPDYYEEASTVSAIELRANEGINFGNPKIQSLIGHETVRRKQIADDGKSLLSRKSVDGPSFDSVRAAETRSATSFDNQRKSIVSFDQSTDFILPLTHQLKDEIFQVPSARKVESSFEVDFDALFSSSPIAQSTPRIRLEPTFEENGGMRLRNVPADSRSLFDPDRSMRGQSSDADANMTPLQNSTQRKTIVKRNNSQVKDVGLGVKSHVSKRRKKHPSPSKAELEGLESALKHYSPRMVSMDAKPQELTLSLGDLQTGEVLSARDSNALLSQAAKRGKGNRLGIFGKPKQSVAGSSLAEPARRPGTKSQKPSMIPKPAGAPTMKRRADFRMFRLASHVNESAMDTDELQWESTAYHIGMRG